MTTLLLMGLAILGAAEAPVARTSVVAPARIETAAAPVTGESLYRRLCASCHGVGGRGDGPAGAALRQRPTDLTRLRSGMQELMRQIDGRRTIRAHGSAQMPVWGEVFEQSLIPEPYRRRTALMQVEAIADYIMRLRRARPPSPSTGPGSP